MSQETMDHGFQYDQNVLNIYTYDKRDCLNIGTMGVNKRLDPKYGENQHHVHFPQSFTLMDIIFNLKRVLISSGVDYVKEGTSFHS
jgi:hypothetical protein